MSDTQQPRIVVLASGKGSNFEAIVRATETRAIPARVVALLSNRPQATALQRAAQHGIPTITIDHTRYPDRETFDHAMMAAIDSYHPDLVVLAGFMRILSSGFVDHYLGRLLNIHPSLLPAYPGLRTHDRALADSVSRHGASVHFVTCDLDSGPVVLQGSVPVLPGDTPERLAERVHAIEYSLYPQAIAWFITGRLRLVDHHATLDGIPINKPRQMSTAKKEVSPS